MIQTFKDGADLMCLTQKINNIIDPFGNIYP